MMHTAAYTAPVQDGRSNGAVQSTGVYEALREQIVDFKLRPNERLTEAQLADEFDTSRTPVREALLKLEREGWVVNRPRHGYTVRDFSIAELDDTYEVRIALEWMSVRLACERMPRPELDRLRDFWTHPSNAVSDATAMLRCDEDFHESIARSTGNQELTRHLHTTNERIRIIRRIDFTSGERVELTFQEHANMLALIRSRDVIRAQQAMESHIRASRTCIEHLAAEGLAQIFLKR